jgi:transglutaminase/protease-like cytokinesis protein 3
MSQRLSMRRALGRLVLLLTLPLLVLAWTTTRASAANVVNYTFHVPASVQTSPCAPGDVLNLSGDIHIVIESTTASSGNYQITNSLNSQLTGTTIPAGIKYLSSENKNDSWFTGAPYPTTHTTAYDWTLVSQAPGSPNYVMHMTLHETVTAAGIPTATVDNLSAECKG